VSVRRLRCPCAPGDEEDEDEDEQQEDRRKETTVALDQDIVHQQDGEPGGHGLRLEPRGTRRRDVRAREMPAGVAQQTAVVSR
jgi:hypothetical protein